MAKENEVPAPETAARKVPAAPVIFTPLAAHIGIRPRDKFYETIKDYKFAGNPRPELAKEALDLVIALADTLPDADMLEAKIEAGGATARQVNVIVFPHTY